jgi:hypothetical protein
MNSWSEQEIKCTVGEVPKIKKKLLWLLAQWYEVRVGGGGIYKVRP